MSKALCHRWYDAFGLHDPRMLSTSACSGCFCPKARVISHAISAWCAQRATPARYHLGTVDNSYAGESSVRDRGQPAGMDAFVPTRLCRAAPDLSTSAPTVPALPEPCPRGIPHATIPWRAFMAWNLRSTCSRNPRLREPSATEQAVTFCCYAKQPGIERCCAHHTFLAASVLIVTCKCAAPRLLASVKPRR